MKIAVKLDLYLEIEFSENVDRARVSKILNDTLIPMAEFWILSDGETLNHSSNAKKIIKRLLPEYVAGRLITKRQLLEGK